MCNAVTQIREITFRVSALWRARFQSGSRTITRAIHKVPEGVLIVSGNKFGDGIKIKVSTSADGN